ncbi:MAG: polysaccharide pyruvyl transferase family protein [Methanobrevibacter sp.]|jgi:hypothetical protein|nr:polysaccharide pyruvyl transferase family protein [Candidatus Methanoflexus mossambicus]
MSKILIHSTPSPLDQYSADEIWRLNAIHNNFGNFAFPFSLTRNLTTENTEVVSDWYGKRLPSPDIINSEFESFILPMANDFGHHFIHEMKKLTDLINKLTIPVVVVGIGGAFVDDNPNFSKPRPYDEVSKNFIKAILNHSNIVGVRGKITGKYLESLGFEENEDFQVIGDPTLYNIGRKLKIRDLNLDKSSNIAFNMTPGAPEGALRFLNDLPKYFEKINYIPQDLAEFSKLYAGMMSISGKTLRDEVDYFPNNWDDIVYKEGKIKLFLNAPSWIDFMKDVDFSIGTRIHGNIIPTLAGVPSLTFYYGARLKELVEFHNLPGIDARLVENDMNLEELIKKFNFHSPEKQHVKNFDNYINFLETNEIKHLYLENGNNAELPFDKQLKEKEILSPLTPINQIENIEEIRYRMKIGYNISQRALINEKKRLINNKNRIKKLERKVKVLKKQNKGLKKQNQISNKYSMKNMLSKIKSRFL